MAAGIIGQPQKHYRPNSLRLTSTNWTRFGRREPRTRLIRSIISRHYLSYCGTGKGRRPPESFRISILCCAIGRVFVGLGVQFNIQSAIQFRVLIILRNCERGAIGAALAGTIATRRHRTPRIGSISTCAQPKACSPHGIKNLRVGRPGRSWSCRRPAPCLSYPKCQESSTPVRGFGNGRSILGADLRADRPNDGRHWPGIGRGRRVTVPGFVPATIPARRHAGPTRPGQLGHFLISAVLNIAIEVLLPYR